MSIALNVDLPDSFLAGQVGSIFASAARFRWVCRHRHLWMLQSAIERSEVFFWTGIFWFGSGLGRLDSLSSLFELEHLPNRSVWYQNGCANVSLVQVQQMHRSELARKALLLSSIYSGTAFLRALTAGLVGLNGQDAIIEILEDLIPYALIQLNQRIRISEARGCISRQLEM